MNKQKSYSKSNVATAGEVIRPNISLFLKHGGCMMTAVIIVQAHSTGTKLKKKLKSLLMIAGNYSNIYPREMNRDKVLSFSPLPAADKKTNNTNDKNKI